MNAENRSIEINGEIVREGTGIYDTKYDHILWVAEIGDYEIMVEVADTYKDDDPFWWSAADDPTRVADGSRIGIDKFQSLVEDGRFEIGSQPSKANVPR